MLFGVGGAPTLFGVCLSIAIGVGPPYVGWLKLVVGGAPGAPIGGLIPAPGGPAICCGPVMCGGPALDAGGLNLGCIGPDGGPVEGGPYVLTGAP